MSDPTPTPPPNPTNRGFIARAVISAGLVLLCALVLGSYALAQWLGTWAWWLIPGIAVTAALAWARRRWTRRRDRKLGITGTRRQRSAARAAARRAAKTARASGRANGARRTKTAASGPGKRAAATRTAATGKRPGAPAAGHRSNSSRRTGTAPRTPGVRGAGARRGAASGARTARASGVRTGARLSGHRPSGYTPPRTRLARMLALKKRHRKRIRKELHALADASREQFAVAWEARQFGDGLSALAMLIDWHAISLRARYAFGALGAGTGLTWTSLMRARARAGRWARQRAEAAFGPWRTLLYTVAADYARRWTFYPPPFGFTTYAPDPPGYRPPGVIDGVVVDSTTHDPTTAPPLTGNIVFRPRASLAPVPMGVTDMAMQPEFEQVKHDVDAIVFGDRVALLTLDAKYRSIAPVLHSVGELLGRLASLTAEDMPTNRPEFAAIGDRINTMAGALFAIAQDAAELSPDLRAAFAEEIEAIDSGHHNADALDVSRNRDL